MEALSRVDAAPALSEDTKWMLAYAAGDASAFDALYARHKGGLYRYVLRHCADTGTADEIFQDVWMRVIQGRRTYAPTAQFATWLYRIAHHRVVDHWRARAVAARAIDPDAFESNDIEDVADETAVSPLDAIETDRLRERLLSALRALPFAQRDAFLLHQEGALSLAEIAELTGANPETVKSRLRYATARLREAVRDLR